MGSPPFRPARKKRSARRSFAGPARLLCIVAAVAGAAGPAPEPAHAQAAAACADLHETVATAGAAAVRDATACAVNAIRAEQRLAPLSPSPALALAAHRHGADMVERRYFAHLSPGGGNIGRRARRAAYMRGPCWVVGENLGVASPQSASADAIVGAWMASPSHRAIILDPEFRHMGVAVMPGAPVDDPAGATFVLNVGANECAPAGAARARVRARVRMG